MHKGRKPRNPSASLRASQTNSRKHGTASAGEAAPTVDSAGAKASRTSTKRLSNSSSTTLPSMHSTHLPCGIGAGAPWIMMKKDHNWCLPHIGCKTHYDSLYRLHRIHLGSRLATWLVTRLCQGAVTQMLIAILSAILDGMISTGLL